MRGDDGSDGVLYRGRVPRGHGLRGARKRRSAGARDGSRGRTEYDRQRRRCDRRVAESVGDKVEHFEAGADDYLTKPFAFAELLVRVKALLRRGPVTRASVLRIGDLELDRLSQQVKRSGKRVELTSKEYGVLEYLVKREPWLPARH